LQWCFILITYRGLLYHFILLTRIDILVGYFKYFFFHMQNHYTCTEHFPVIIFFFKFNIYFLTAKISRRYFKGLFVSRVTWVYQTEWLLEYFKRIPENLAHEILCYYKPQESRCGICRA
jgi:hypothetical protein